MTFQTHPYFLTGRTIYLIVIKGYELDTNLIDYWLQQIKSASTLGKSNIILVATHIDISKFTDAKFLKIKEQFEIYLKQERVHSCFFISNKTKENISKLKENLFIILENHPFHNITIPASWNRLSLHCKYLREKQNIKVVEWSIFKTKVLKNAQISKDFIDKAMEFVRDSGQICYHKNSRSNYPNFVVLEPKWLSFMINEINKYFLKENIQNGILEHDKFNLVWNNDANENQDKFCTFTDSLINHFIQTIESFEIAYQMRGDPPRILIPSLLVDGLPDNVSDFWEPQVPLEMQQYGRIYKFYSTEGLFIFSRLIVRFLHLLDTKTLLLWKQGIILQSNNEKAIIYFDIHEYSLIIKLRAPKQTLPSFLRILLSTIDTGITSINSSCKFDTLIPCLHCVRFNAYSSPYKFSKKECIEALTSGSPFVYCHKIKSNSRCVRVDILAPDLSFGNVPLITNLELGKQIGKGGFGLVFKGKLDEEIVAIKELSCVSFISFNIFPFY